MRDMTLPCLTRREPLSSMPSSRVGGSSVTSNQLPVSLVNLLGTMITNSPKLHPLPRGRNLSAGHSSPHPYPVISGVNQFFTAAVQLPFVVRGCAWQRLSPADPELPQVR